MVMPTRPTNEVYPVEKNGKYLGLASKKQMTDHNLKLYDPLKVAAEAKAKAELDAKVKKEAAEAEIKKEGSDPADVRKAPGTQEAPKLAQADAAAKKAVLDPGPKK